MSDQLFCFKNPSVAEIIYSVMLKDQKQRLHTQIAEWCAPHRTAPLAASWHRRHTTSRVVAPPASWVHHYIRTRLLHPRMAARPVHSPSPSSSHHLSRYVRVLKLRLDEQKPTDVVLTLIAVHSVCRCFCPPPTHPSLPFSCFCSSP